MKIILLASATAGHLFPAKVIYEKYKKRNYDVYIVAENKTIPHTVLNNIKDTIYIQPITSVIKYYDGVKQLLQYDKDTLFISFGGRVSSLLPYLFIKGYRNIYIYELNRVMGRSNKLAMPFSRYVFSYFPLENNNKKIQVIGHPQEDERVSNNIRIDGKKILILTGSNGSKDLFKLFDDIQEKHKELDMTISLGKLKYKFKSNIKTVGFINTKLYQKYDLIIARSGAGTIVDAIRYNIPIIFLPSPFVKDNHQEENAKFLNELLSIKYLMPKDYTKVYENIINEMKYERRTELVSNYKTFQKQNVFLNMNGLIKNENIK